LQDQGYIPGFLKGITLASDARIFKNLRSSLAKNTASKNF